MNRIAIVITTAGLVQAPSALAQSYSAEVLPPLPGASESLGYAINDSGVVVGQCNFPSLPSQATRWVSASPEALGVIAPFQVGVARGINNTGVIVGECFSGPTIFAGVPFVWSDGVMMQLPMASKAYGIAFGISDSGVIVGGVWDSSAVANPSACVWRMVGGQWTISLLPGLTGPSLWASGVNNSGVAVGITIDPTGTFRAGRWDDLSAPPAPVGCAAPDAFRAGAWSINDAGTVSVGFVNAVQSHGLAFLSAPGDCTDLGLLPHDGGGTYTSLIGHRLNNAGTVVGHAYNGDPNDPFVILDCRAIVWNGGASRAFNDLLVPHNPGLDILQAWGINQSGQVAALGTESGSRRAFRLTPCVANCDASTVSPTLNVNDFACFLNRFAAGQPYANCDGSTAPPVLNVLDFSCFLNRFAAGCP